MLLLPQRCIGLLSVISILHAIRLPDFLHKHVEVKLGYGSFIGKVDFTERLERWDGIPFAEPPVGPLRFRNPIKPTKQYWNHDCTKHAPACPQQTFGGNTSSAPFKSWVNLLSLPLSYIRTSGPGQEDCLTLDIARPAGVTNTSRLPVMFFIFPGGFNHGTSWQLTPRSIVKKSVEMDLPIIHVSANHRVNAFGFLGGREVGQAGVGNLGLKDQALTLEWIQTHISQFGGDPDKVTIYGESSGAISVSHHLLAHQGQHKGLFRAAIAQSGTALPVGKLSEGAGQETFDYIVKSAGCESSADKINCLRDVPYRKILDAVEHFPGTFSFGAFPLTFGPAVDGEFVTESMELALKAGRFARVPTIAGDAFDEGTVLALSTLPLRSEEDLRKFMSQRFKKATPETINKLLQLWPSNPEAGSPFASGSKYALTPVYKQYSAILGDLGFQGLRRLFLRETSHSMPTWSYIDQAQKDLPIIGAFHGSELPALFGFLPGDRKEEYQKRWIAFANHLDPNYPGLPQWSSYDKGSMDLIIDKNGSHGMEPDTFRSTAIDYYLSNIEQLNFGLS